MVGEVEPDEVDEIDAERGRPLAPGMVIGSVCFALRLSLKLICRMGGRRMKVRMQFPLYICGARLAIDQIHVTYVSFPICKLF